MKFLKFVILGMFILPLSACGKHPIMLHGAGATFPAPIYTKLFSMYTAKSGVQVSYQAVGSGAGIQNIGTGIVDFGATDAFLSDNEIAQYATQNIELLHIPAVLAAVNFTYNIPGLGTDKELLALDPQTIYNIYSGNITKWNDPAIQKLNPNLTLPDLTIIPVYRSDSSGTTFTMTEFMSKASSEWSETFGTGKTINWTTGIGQKGNSSMIAFTKENEGAISYVDFVYAVQNNIPTVRVKNKSGNFVIGDINNAEAAAMYTIIPNDTRVSLTDSIGSNAAPMTTFSYILVRKEQNYNKRSIEQAQALVKMLQWMYTEESQAEHAKLHFAPMPPNVIELGKEIIKEIVYDGKPVVDSLTN